MIKRLRESKAKLSELVKARLTRASTERADMLAWAAELRQLQEGIGTGEPILSEKLLEGGARGTAFFYVVWTRCTSPRRWWLAL